MFVHWLRRVLLRCYSICRTALSPASSCPEIDCSEICRDSSPIRANQSISAILAKGRFDRRLSALSYSEILPKKRFVARRSIQLSYGRTVGPLAVRLDYDRARSTATQAHYSRQNRYRHLNGLACGPRSGRDVENIVPRRCRSRRPLWQAVAS